MINEKTINDINYEFLKKQFPHAVSIDEDGKYVIDPTKLQMSLDPSKAEIKEDGYGLNWVGKKEAYYKAFSKNYKVLKPLNDNNSKNWDTTDNILIKGDNLDALKILRQNYFEAIKMIYIDPPYNTKNDGFVYNDNFTSSTKETLEELGYDEENVEYIENIQGAKTHSGWLSFMYPRLLLARDLLKDDGVIFISIDDNEVAQLKLLCDEVFGGDNFVATLTTVMNLKGNNDEYAFAGTHEYILVYTKYTHHTKFNNIPLKNKKEIKQIWDEDKDGFFKLGTLKSGGENGAREKRPNLYFPIYINKKNLTFSINRDIDYTDIIYPISKDGKDLTWRWSKEKINNEKHNILISLDNINNIRIERKLRAQNNIPSIKPKTIFYKPEYSSGNGVKIIKELFENKKIFSYSKPIELIKDILSIATTKNDIILDFFAGSGTTAHAVMDLNAQDDGNRKFICVQWAEETPEKSEAKKAGYETIFDITQERIKRAGDKIIKDDITKQDLDIGFRTFEIVEDAKQKIYQKSIEDMTQDDLLAFTKNVVESSEDILYNLLVAESLPLNTKIKTLIDDKLYLASNVAFVLGNVSIDELIAKLKSQKELEYITVYSPNIGDDKFTLECESAISSIGIKSDKLRFRG